MKPALIAICAALAISCNNEVKDAESKTNDSTGTATVASTDAAPKSEEWIPVDSATAMQKMMEVGTPGEEQKMLESSNGNWKAEISMWEAPDKQPTMSKGMVTNKMVLGGRYQLSSFKGDMMGFPFEGSSTTGYDKGRKVWVSTWIDNMSTAIMTMEGTWDDASKSIIMKGQMLCPANGKMCEIKQVMKKVDDKTEVMEMYGPDMKTGKQYKNMEMKLTKA